MAKDHDQMPGKAFSSRDTQVDPIYQDLDIEPEEILDTLKSMTPQAKNVLTGWLEDFVEINRQ